jgi:hypothetical protein
MGEMLEIVAMQGQRIDQQERDLSELRQLVLMQQTSSRSTSSGHVRGNMCKAAAEDARVRLQGAA